MAEEQREAMEQQAAAPASSLLDEIIEASKIKPTDEGYDVTRAGLQEFIREIAASGTTPKVSGALVDAMIVELDKKLSDQVNEIMHNSQFRELESSWRSLKFLVDNVDFRQNTKVEILNVSKQDLIDDFEDSPEVVKSGLYKHIIPMCLHGMSICMPRCKWVEENCEIVRKSLTKDWKFSHKDDCSTSQETQ